MLYHGRLAWFLKLHLRPLSVLFGLAATATQVACIRVTTVNVAQRTSLEHQLMGDLESVSEEELLAASVRAGAGINPAGSVGPGSLDALASRAVSARRRQVFNRDDVLRLKAAGCLGETQAARLVVRACAQDRPSSDAALLDEDLIGIAPNLAARLVAEENHDRDAIVDWVIAVDPQLTNAQRDQVASMYTRLLAQARLPGHWYQDAAGKWQQAVESAR